jgi:hypothetical protein
VQNGTYKHRYNLTGVYTMKTGALRGLRVGSGVQVYGQRLIANEIDRPYDYVYARAYHLVSASLGYPVKVGRHRLDVQVNVDNVLNYDTPMINGMFIYGDRLIPYGFRRMNPPELRFTSTLKF